MIKHPPIMINKRISKLTLSTEEFDKTKRYAIKFYRNVNKITSWQFNPNDQKTARKRKQQQITFWFCLPANMQLQKSRSKKTFQINLRARNN